VNNFHSEYGSYPDRDTAKLLTSRKPHGLDLSGDSSNDYFRQLIAAGIAKSEHPFFAKSAFAKHAPDNSISGTRVLAPGEVGWGYVMNGGSSLPDTSPDIPLCVTPLRPGQPGGFDPAPFQRKAAVVHPDCSVKLLTIQPDGRVATDNGRILMETGPGSIWPAGVNPVIKSPAMRKP